MGLIDAVNEAVEAEVSERVGRIQEKYSGFIDPEFFAGSKLTVPEAARLIGWDARTVRFYVSRGMVPLHPESTESKPLIRASDALRLPGRGLKHMRINR